MPETLPTLTEDHHGPLAVAPKLSLFQIEHELVELIEFRESAETDEERKAADAQIQVYVEKEVRKVDNIRSYLRHCDVMATAAKEESRLQADRAKAWTGRMDRLKASVLGIMQMIGEKKLEGRTGTLSVRGNGGQQALTITDESLVPDEFCDMTLIVPASIWKRDRTLASIAGTRSVKNDLVRKALSEPCPVCKGEKAIFPPVDWKDQTQIKCPGCSGEGTRRVPGARLEPRGSHLEVK